MLLYVAASAWLPELTGSVVRCPVLTLTGHQCPSCGLTRALLALLRGDVAGAWRLNPLVVPAAVLAVVFPILVLLDVIAGTALLPRLCCVADKHSRKAAIGRP